MDKKQKEIENALRVKASKGDIKAITFYLCNRDPDRWKPLSQAGQEISGVRKRIQIITTTDIEDTEETDGDRAN